MVGYFGDDPGDPVIVPARAASPASRARCSTAAAPTRPTASVASTSPSIPRSRSSTKTAHARAGSPTAPDQEQSDELTLTRRCRELGTVRSLLRLPAEAEVTIFARGGALGAGALSSDAKIWPMLSRDECCERLPTAACPKPKASSGLARPAWRLIRRRGSHCRDGRDPKIGGGADLGRAIMADQRVRGWVRTVGPDQLRHAAGSRR